ncbi:MAG: hypothetical protein MI866_24125 [Bacteroidales bacterium]|nr:hypothetical protein [Bacteroidales bacterium]
MQRILPIIIILGLIACKTETKTVDSFGQTEPGNTPEKFAEGIISVKGRFEHGISFTPDSKELAFGILNKGDFSGTIYHSEISTGKWTSPELFEPLKNKSAYLPYFTPNGKAILYAQSRPDTNNGFTDIWILERINDSWAHPQKVDTPISSMSRESTACMSLNGTIYFSSNRDGNGLADLYCSSIDNGQYRNVKRLNSISSVRDEESIFIAPDESYIIFSRYATNEKGPDLFISYKNNTGNWTQAASLDTAINTADWERRPFVSTDNRFLFFTKQIFDDKGYAESDIYWVSTQKIFKPFVFQPISPKIIKLGQEFKLSLPENYFKDIDNKTLEISLNNEKHHWAKFDKMKMTLTLNPKELGEFALTFKAIDKYANETENTIKIVVEE